MSSRKASFFLLLTLQLIVPNIALGQNTDEFIRNQLSSATRLKILKPFPQVENFQDLEKNKEFYANRIGYEDSVYAKELLEFYIPDITKIHDSNVIAKFSYIEVTPLLLFLNCYRERFSKVTRVARNSNSNQAREVILNSATRVFNSCVDLRNTQQLVQINYQNGKMDFLDAINSYEKIHEEHIKRLNIIENDTLESLDDIKSGRPNRHAKSNKFRESARSDVVAQVLNYASGLKEDASGNIFFYPVNTENGRCEYKLYTDQGTVEGDIAAQYAQAGKFLSQLGIPGVSEAASGLVDVVDLNKGNLQNINFYKLQGAQRNKFTGLTAYLRYQSRVEGLPDMFECDSNSCNIDRLKRGWSLVASKCKGVTKAF